MLTRSFHQAGHEVIVLSRSPTTIAVPWQIIPWDMSAIDGSDIVINLAGQSVNCRYTAANREEILDSRITSTRVIGRAIEQAKCPPRLWLQASTATIYAHRYEAANDELTGIIGGTEPNVPLTWNFSIDVARKWEQAADECPTPNTRKVLMRSALTLSPDAGGIFDVLLGLVRRGIGGTAGNGRQFISWIHDQDFVRAVNFLIEHEELAGPVNLSSPEPVPNAEFMRELRAAWGARLGLPANVWMLTIGAVLMRTETELILKSRRVVPRRILEAGFQFTFSTWSHAAVDLCKRWKAAHNKCGHQANLV